MRGGNQKAGPCEDVPLMAGDPLTTLRPGSELTIRITETVGHPGHYRIMFDDDVMDGEDFPDPVNCDDVGTPDGEKLLADKLLPAQGATCPGFHEPAERTVESGAAYSFQVTLPDIECDRCALQVIQVMTDAGKADANGNWDPAGGKGLYYRCANVRLSNAEDVTPDPGAVPDPDVEIDPDNETDPTTDSPGNGPVGGTVGCQAGAGSTGCALAGLFIGGLLFRRRRVC